MIRNHDRTVVEVGLGSRTYPIIIARGLLDAIGRDLYRRKIANRFGVISDEHVADLYGRKLMDSLVKAGISAELFTFPRGEASKNMDTVVDLARRLVRAGFDRGDGLIALGGGVSGDIGGFLASIYMRGIPFVQVPTTLLAQVDSSVGGKTGVDIPEGKNLLGTFYQPRAVYIDMDVLQTLPRTEVLGGLAEVVKYGVIHDVAFFSYLEEHSERILQLDDGVTAAIIARSCAIKAWVVEQDEKESGLRRILNFGHTFGHAVEAASGYSLIHGLAVAIGMRTAADLAVQTGRMAARERARLVTLLQSYGLPTEIPPELDRTVIRRYLLADKKTVAGRIFFVLPEKIGQVVVTDEVASADIDAVLGDDYHQDRNPLR